MAQFRGEVLGVIALIDPGGTWADVNRGALEHGATVLALELAHLRSVAEAELRLGGDLVEELLAGGNLEGILDRCPGDRLRPRPPPSGRRGRSREPGRRQRRAVPGRAAGRTRPRCRLVAGGARRPHRLLADAEADWSAFRLAVLADLGSGGRCRVGVGGRCSAPAEFARSYRQAQLALSVQASLVAPIR